MDFVAAKCPQCGGDLRMPFGVDRVNCTYCGAEVVTPFAQQSTTGTIPHTLLSLGHAAAVAGDQKQAFEYYSRVLEAEPTNSAAWLGKAGAAGWQSTLSDWRLMEAVSYTRKAFEFCPDDYRDPATKYAIAMLLWLTRTHHVVAYKHFTEAASAQAASGYLYQVATIVASLRYLCDLDPKNPEVYKAIVELAEASRHAAIMTGAWGTAERRRSAWISRFSYGTFMTSP